MVGCTKEVVNVILSVSIFTLFNPAVNKKVKDNKTNYLNK